jgi:protein TonB
MAAAPFQSAAILQPQPGPLEQVATLASGANPIPVRQSSVTPLYPPQAEAIAATATVTFRAVVDAGGSVAELRLLSLDAGVDGVTVRMTGTGGLERMVAAIDKAQMKGRDGGVIDTNALRAAIVAFVDAAAVAIQQWRYEPAREPVAFDITVRFASADRVSDNVSAPAAARSQVTGDGALRVGGNVRTPTKVKDVRPVYPQEAKDARVQGVVILELRIGGDGRVEDAKVLRSIPMLDAAAIEAARQWEFTPTLLNGVPTPVIMTVTMQFSLQ